MVTGLVEEAGVVESVDATKAGIQLTVKTRVCASDLKLGDSLAVNGCCLTVTKLTGTGKLKTARFDLLKETWDRTNLQFVKRGSIVNLERPLRADARLGGHFVTGHIDGLGKITKWERKGADHILEIAAPADIMRYVIFKGSVAVDGISLTVAAVTRRTFTIWIIPHTYDVTALRERKAGDFVNLEADLLGKYVEKFSAAACAS